ncbi:MAG: Nucleoid occlusion protein [Eubacteriales bacterium SKADARSKE-1]|nr:Nucleoid occlusion protein [Eubacteriales bacterium SKADARSKE-1]
MFFNQTTDKIRSVPVIQIESNRAQPRTHFSKQELESLSQSIKENGILQPLTVRKILASRYELIAGERRLRASIMAGFKSVPCIILDCDETQSAVFALLENLQRADLGPFEEAEGIQRLINGSGMTQEMAAQKLGKKQSTIANKLRLLKLTKEERQKIVGAGLTERHARALLKVDDIELREVALSRIILKGLNVQKSEILIDSMLEHKNKKGLNSHKTIVIKDLRIFMNTINKAIDTMNLSGIKAQREQRETEEYIEYMVRIPKIMALKKAN